jgi:hypothetical protein
VKDLPANRSSTHEKLPSPDRALIIALRYGAAIYLFLPFTTYFRTKDLLALKSCLRLVLAAVLLTTTLAWAITDLTPSFGPPFCILRPRRTVLSLTPLPLFLLSSHRPAQTPSPQTRGSKAPPVSSLCLHTLSLHIIRSRRPQTAAAGSSLQAETPRELPSPTSNIRTIPSCCISATSPPLAALRSAHPHCIRRDSACISTPPPFSSGFVAVEIVC